MSRTLFKLTYEVKEHSIPTKKTLTFIDFMDAVNAGRNIANTTVLLSKPLIEETAA
jgi:hypothetical protein